MVRNENTVSLSLRSFCLVSFFFLLCMWISFDDDDDCG